MHFVLEMQQRNAETPRWDAASFAAYDESVSTLFAFSSGALRSIDSDERKTRADEERKERK